MLDNGDGTTEGEDVVDSLADTEVIESLSFFGYWPFSVSYFSCLIFLVNRSSETYYSLYCCFAVRQLSIFCLES